MKPNSAIFAGGLLAAIFMALLPAAATPAASTQCQAAAKISPLVCEEGGPFLCVNTPPGSVKGDFVILKGRLNLENTSFGSLSVMTQHEYTKEIHTIALPAGWHPADGGIFETRIPLPELGPYTIFVAATRQQGNSMQTLVRTSRVIAPTVTPDVVTYEPNIAAGVVPDGTRIVRVTLDLLAGCGESKEICDFIGAATGGVEVSVENTMHPANKKVSCETNSIQGGAGQFVVGVPIWPGENQLAITICNAVTGFDKTHCPKITPPPFRTGGATSQIEILPPLGGGPLLWDPESTPHWKLRFKISGFTPKVCDDSVQVGFNFKPSQKVCADAQGIFETPLMPEAGYNIAAIQANVGGQKLLESQAAGWGSALKPFDKEGRLKAKKEWTLQRGLNFLFPKAVLESFIPRVNEYLGSPALKKKLEEWTEKIGREKTSPTVDAMREEKTAIKKELGFCPVGGGLGALRLRLMSPPQIGKIEWKSLSLGENRLQAWLAAEDVRITAQLYKDENGDASPDIDPLPLKISFRTLGLAPILEQGPADSDGKRLWRLSSPETDCTYKRAGACFKMPALFTPKRFKGNASSSGAFAVCDRSQHISEKMDKICHALNVVDRQTGGVFQEKILDALNRAYACDGAATLNTFFQSGMPLHPKTDLFEGVGALSLEELKISPEGLAAALNTRFGDEAMMESWPEELRRRGPGILIGPAPTLGIPAGENISVGISTAVVSQFFWGLLSPSGGDFSLTLDDDFFRARGIDFDERCRQKEGEKKDPLCNIRPRAQEILGNPITAYGYLNPKDPVRLTLVPSKAFPLRLQILNAREKLIRLELADWEVTISSEKEPLITARLSMKITGKLSETGLQLLQDQSAVWVTPIEKTNTTVIPGSALLAELKEKLQSAVNLYSGQEISLTALKEKLGFSGEFILGENQIKISIPSPQIHFPPPSE